jgi:hypothetical protein
MREMGLLYLSLGEDSWEYKEAKERFVAFLRGYKEALSGIAQGLEHENSEQLNLFRVA